jgi:hypothetical protein
MAEFTKNTLQITHHFDQNTKRHYLNGTQTVYHCHHYATLYTQLALDAGETALMAECAEDSFYAIFVQHFAQNKLTDLPQRVDMVCQYYAAVGLGHLAVEFLGDDSAQFVSAHSHLEQGWIKKWGQYDRPVNYIGCGFVSAAIAAALNQPVRSFATFETASIVVGDTQTIFKSYKK